MKRIGYILLSSVILLTVYTLALAQLEAKTAKYLLRVLTGESVRGYFGSAVEGSYAWSGGSPLFAISATGEMNGPTRIGKVEFYDGLQADKPTISISGKVEGELFGKAISGGADWNGDGIPDFAVGAPDGSTGKDKEVAGKVYLYFGGADFGKSAVAVLSIGEAKDGFGEAVCLKDDVNGDGLGDLIVGAPRSAKSGATSGRAYVWFGKRNGGPSAAPDVEIKLGTTNDLFGTCIAVGDLNGDGHADLAIGSPHHNVGDKIPGGVFIFHGGKGVNLAQASQILSGENTGFQDEFGESVAVIPDQDGDKTSELIVGAPKVMTGNAQYGKVYIYHGGSKLGPDPSQTFAGHSEAGLFGQNVYSCGDLNGDGKGDFAIQAANEAVSRGVVYLYYGGWDKEFYAFSGESTGDRAGGALTVIGDLDHSGGQEVLVGARWSKAAAENGGRVYVLSIQ
jgi:hypothetical protein